MLGQLKEECLSLPREQVSPQRGTFHSMVTEDPEMQKIFQLITKVSATNSTVLIFGESGTGKELVARAIHALSAVRGHFVPVNCGAIPDNLLESELFGYEKGAFTGAVSSKPGRFSLADEGTIFLDEIGEMSPHLQVKLLRVLQDKVVEPVGSVKTQTVSTRVVAATNVNLRKKVDSGGFREDLYYRLQVVPIELPPLRARRADIPLLVQRFSEKYALLHNRKPLVLSSEAAEMFLNYFWPGNIRELENLIERLSIMVEGNAVYRTDLPLHILEGRSAGASSVVSPMLPQNGLDFNLVVEEFENSLIVQALDRCSGNKKAAARLLNLNRTTLVEKIKKKGLIAEEEKGNSPFSMNF